MDPSPSALIGVVLTSSAVTGVITLAVQNFFQRRKIKSEAEKTDADAAAVNVETALELVQPLRTEIKELRTEVLALRAQVRETTHELEACRDSSRAKDERLTRADAHIREQNAELERLRGEGRI